MSHPSVVGLQLLPRPVAWVFTGGGARSAAQVGMAEVLLEQGLRPDLVVGSGLGALNAVALAEGTADLRALRTAWHRLGDESALASLSSAAVRAFSPRRTGKSAQTYHEILATAVPGDPGRPVPPDLCLVASDLTTGRAVVMSGGILEALTAAATIPVVFPPVPIGTSLLVDGSLTAAAPLDQARAAGAATVILLDTGAAAVEADSVPELRWWQVAGLAYGHQIRGQLGHALIRTAPLLPVVTLTTADGSQLDFTDPAEHFAIGRSTASHALVHGVGDQADWAPGLYGIPAGLSHDPRLTGLIRWADPT